MIKKKKKDLTKIPIDRIYKTEAYDAVIAFCDDAEGGSSDFMLCDIYDKQQIVNLIVPIIRKEERMKIRRLPVAEDNSLEEG